MALVRIDPGTPQWWKLAALQLEQVFQPQVPIMPTQLKGYATADLPDAANWPRCMAFDLTLNAPVYSDGTNWTAL